jgi:hypothetical protein
MQFGISSGQYSMYVWLNGSWRRFVAV